MKKILLKAIIVLLPVTIISCSTYKGHREVANIPVAGEVGNPVAASLEAMDTLAKQCMAELVASGNKENCEKYEKAQGQIDVKTKAYQCNLDKTRDILDLEVEDCIASSHMAKVASELSGAPSPAILDASSCKQNIRNRFCN